MTEKQPDHLPYLPNTESSRDAMLKAIGVNSFEDLISHIPSELRVKALNLPDGLSEMELTKELSSLAAKNTPASAQACFLGGGSYRRFVPSIVGAITSRSEFATAYTPYQPEVAQGSLQVIYEFQSAICLLTGMDVANASMYDGPTACAEAALMACRLNNRRKVVVSETINPEYSAVTKTYAEACDLTYQSIPNKNGSTDLSALPSDDQIAAVVVQYPNYFGCLEDLKTIAEATHKVGALLVVITDPVSLAILEAPAAFGADIVVGDAQACGNYLSFGGPSAGYMATRKDFVRQLPGRLAGKTLDIEGRTAYTLTLQTREQHIRRAKATSNICTNQALNALAMLVYLTALGPSGLSEVATLSYEKAHYLAEALTKIEGVKLVFEAPFFNEFAITTSKPAEELLALLAKENILGGISLEQGENPIKNGILIATTELNDRAQLDLYATALKNLLSAKSAKDGARGKSVEAESVSIIAFDKASSAVK